MSIPFLHPKKALKSDIFKHSKKLLFSLPVGRQNPRAPLPVHSNFDAHLLGGHSSQARHKKYQFYVPQNIANAGFTPNRSCKASQGQNQAVFDLTSVGCQSITVASRAASLTTS